MAYVLVKANRQQWTVPEAELAHLFQTADVLATLEKIMNWQKTTWNWNDADGNPNWDDPHVLMVGRSWDWEDREWLQFLKYDKPAGDPSDASHPAVQLWKLQGWLLQHPPTNNTDNITPLCTVILIRHEDMV